MDGSAPKKVLQYTDQHDQDLYKKVSTGLNNAGHHVTAADVNPEDNSPIEKATEEAGNFIRYTGAYLEDAVRGGNETGRIYTVSKGGKSPALINTERQGILAKLRRAAPWK